MKAKIVSNVVSWHGFANGTIVTGIFNEKDGDYLCVDVENSDDEWWVDPIDLEIIEE